jgi:L-prolyl-PCP dehydrogenase
VHAILTQLVSGIALRMFGSEDQKQRYLPPVCSGTKIVAQAATEPDSGSDVFAMRTHAEPRDGGYVLNGSKLFTSNGPIADFVLVLAATNPDSKGFGRHSMFVVDKDAAGFRSGKPLMKMGLRTLLNSELVLENCQVPATNLVGKQDQGGIIFNEVMEWERILFAAAHVGTMWRLGEECVAYARSRRQFGQAIGKFQAVSSKIARIQMNTELARLMVYKAATLKDAGRRAAFEAATVKVFGSESLKQAALDAVQIHGGYGYMTESEVERDLRDSIASTIYSGTVELNTQIIAKLAGL